MMKVDSWVLKHIHNYSEWYLVVGKFAVSFRELTNRGLSHVSWCTCNVSWTMILGSRSSGLVLQERRFMNQLPNFVAFCYNLLAAWAEIHESCLSPHGSRVNNHKGLGQAARVETHDSRVMELVA